MSERARFFAESEWTGGVIGLGYVGLPLAVTMVRSGLPAIGFDVSADRVARIAGGDSPVEDVSDDELAWALAHGLRVTADTADLAEADAVFVCVPSPLGRHREPDLSYIEAAADTIAAVIRPGMLVALESTTYPGTTEDILLPAVTGGGLVLDEDVFLAFSPERVDPGSSFSTGEIPKVVGGVTPASTEVAAAAYRRIVTSVHPVSSAKSAEMSKLLENTYRAVNIALINEMAQLCHELDIDIWEVIDAAASKPFGFHPFYPGPGVGGHCIPLDPQFLAWRAKEANFATRFIDLAEQVNARMPHYTAGRVSDLLNLHGHPVSGTRTLGVGISYKPDIADARESASIEVLKELARRGADVAVLDPVVGADATAALGFASVAPGDDLTSFTVAVILTDHSRLDLAAIADQVPLVLDARGAYRRAGIARDNVLPL
jgi:UDP-N-acetyl-D-glucosamine dehydrogenase